MSDDIKEARALDAVDDLDRDYYLETINRLAKESQEVGRLTALNNMMRAKLQELQETAEDRSPLEDVELARLGDAVIEAAEAWYYYRLGSPYEQEYARLLTLEQAIEALLKARQG